MKISLLKMLPRLVIALLVTGCAAAPETPKADAPKAEAPSKPEAQARTPVTSPTLGQPVSPRQRLLERLTDMAGKDPFHTGIQYLAAKVAASMNDEQQTMAWLDRLSRTGLGDELEPDDFGAIAELPAWRARAESFARAAPPVGTARITAETRCATLLPEGIAWDPRRKELLISSGRLRNVVAVDAQGNCRMLLTARDERIFSVLGMTVDAGNDSLWIASSTAPFMIDTRQSDKGKASIAHIDLGSGKVLAVHQLADAMLNDLTIAPDGSVYVTDSQGGRIMRLRPRGDKLEPIVEGNSLEGPNGIVALDTGDLLVADFNGLSIIATPSLTPVVKRLATPNGMYLGGIDGLARSGTKIVGLQNLVGRSRVWSLTIDASTSRVTDAKLLLRGHPDFRNPTTGVIVGGNRYLFVADPNLQKALPSGEISPLPAGRSGYRILELPI